MSPGNIDVPGRARCVMVTIVGNGNSTNTLGKGINPTIPSPAMSKYV